MRLFELAGELNTSTRDLFKQAEGLSIEVSTYIMELSDADVKALRSGFRQRSSVEVADEKVAMLHKLDEKRAAILAIAEKTAEVESRLLEEGITRTEEIRKDFLTRSGMLVTADESEKVETPTPEKEVEPAAVEVVEELTETPVVQEVELEKKEEKESEKEETEDLLKALPQRPLQAPRPEFVPAPPVAAEPAEESAKTEAPEPAKKPVSKTKTTKTEPSASPKKDKRPRPIHPLDDEDDDDSVYLTGNLSRRVKDPVSRTPAKAGKKEEEGIDRGDKIVRRGTKAAAQKTPVVPVEEEDSDDSLKIHGPITVKELAEKLDTRANLIITELMKLGILASINQSVEPEAAVQVAEKLGFALEQEKSRRSRDKRPVIRTPGQDDDIPEDRPDQLMPRAPVVTFLGHVDHGKTSLMDSIRKAHVASGEAGGITQHIAAYTVDINGQKITFLDTPGHAAFSSMRARGASLTDIAVIIIAADDGIMPQTKEAIRHAREADVTIMVAINKCDLPQANTMRVMQQLQAENLTPEEWGGDTIVCQVSAITGDGVGNLLDMILLQSEILELTANPNRRADGTVVEAQVQSGIGPSVNVLVTGGTLELGDIVLCEEFHGRVRAITDSSGRRVKSIGPSDAATVLGLSGVPEAGARFRVMTNERRARELAADFAQEKKEVLLGGVTKARSVDDIFKKMHEAEKLELNIILRADVQGSVEAVQDSIEEIKSEKVNCNILHSGAGSITSTDVQRAGSSADAVIIGFNVSTESGVNSEARHLGVRIKTFRIIYELLDFVKQEMLDIIPVEYKEVIRGHAQVKQVFALSNIGNAAGSLVLDGAITRDGKARVLRNKKVIHSGDFASIRHFKDEVKEVTQGQECGILLADFESFQEGDIIECFALEPLPKSL
ncbi:MAG: translation initiation factor IF-2 [Lentisphaerae bacterium]|nr:translation initiation factor IF-2 [Lentisphaerota bacterium]